MGKLKSLYIYYISGTGNAEASSYWIADEAEKHGIKTHVQKIDRDENIKFPKNGSDTLLGFAFPTHGFNAAPIMLKFIAGFPSGMGRDVFLLNTRAGMKLYKLFMPGMSGVALLLPAFILWLKGYRCIGFRPVDLPSNWISLHPGLRKKVIVSIFERCEKIVRRFTGKILSGRKVYRGLFSLPVDILISPISLAYYVGGRFFLAKTFISNNKCTNCGLCIKECPTTSIIEVSKRPYWKLTCESCMRCMNHCPQRAIESAHGMAIAFWIIFSAINGQILFFIINALKVTTETWWWWLISNIISIGGMVLITTLLYWLMHHAMSIKPVKYLVLFTSLTALPFWRRYRYMNKSKGHEIQDQDPPTS
ncbi:MAG TPA: EFR1 family ferrodoxin [Bacteroidales bacterium]|nr:EFR1 family ferrodoxin [Bacteroidales bacterium]